MDNGWFKRQAISSKLDIESLPDWLKKPREHTCIKDDGGTPNRKCYACEEEKIEMNDTTLSNALDQIERIMVVIKKKFPNQTVNETMALAKEIWKAIQ